MIIYFKVTCLHNGGEGGEVIYLQEYIKKVFEPNYRAELDCHSSTCAVLVKVLNRESCLL